MRTPEWGWPLSAALAAIFALLSHPAWAQPARSWSLAADSHFEVYSQAGPQSARTALDWFERLRGWVIRETGLQPDRMRPARVIGFASPAEYQRYRLRGPSDAHYVGTEGRDYIVMALAGEAEFGIAAHEYAHLVLHAAGFELPQWLGEGLAELFATVRIDARGARLGGDRPEHSRLLRERQWMPLERLWQTSDRSAMFYAEAWALADMLAFSPEYRPLLRAFLAAVASRQSTTAALSAYGKTADEVAADLRSWVRRGRAAAALDLPAVTPETQDVIASDVSPLGATQLLAGLLLDAGEHTRAADLYRDLLRVAPANGDVHAGLGMLAYYAGDRAAASAHWSRAVALGVADDALCFRYAALADQTGTAAAEIRPVLERALAIRPDFDDARYRLALLEKNAGRAEAAIAHLRAMREVAPARAFAYWAALADALNSTERRDEAEAAATKAVAHASTPAEKTLAADLAWMARTEIAVRLAPDAGGRPRMVTTRIPRRTADWNPFIEAGDEVRRAEGVLRDLDCSGPAPLLTVETGSGKVALAIADASRVQMRNAPEEFTCGPQPGNPVTVTYAAPRNPDTPGIVRGIEFR